MSTPNKTIGQRLREERKRLSLSQTDFAKAVGVHLNTQSRYEKGERGPDGAYLQAIGKIGVDVGYVMGHSIWTPAQKLDDMLNEYKIGAKGDSLIGCFGQVIPGHEAQYEGDRAGDALLGALGVSSDDWNRITEKLIRLNESGIPTINWFEPAWGLEIAEASSLIKKLVDEAAALDSLLLASVLEGVDSVLSSKGLSLPYTKKAQAVAMLYRAFKTSGKVDPAMIEEAVKLAAG